MLNLYIEKEFLDNFYLVYDEKRASRVQTIVYEMLIDYPESKWFLNCEIDSIEQLEELKKNNPLIGSKAANNFPPNPVKSIMGAVLNQSENETSIVFMSEEQDWFDQAERQGVLCFSFGNYENKISEIIETYHYKIDLSEKDFNWRKIKFISTLNQIKINDNYILVDKAAQKIDKNLSPLLKNAIDHYDRIVNVEVYTKDLNPLQPGGSEQVKAAAVQKSQKLNRVFGNYKAKFKIINNSVSSFPFNFHDRMVLTNFQIVDSGMGFNLVPHKISNSQIISETIFELYSYRRLKNLASEHNRYFKKITNQNFQTSEFTYL